MIVSRSEPTRRSSRVSRPVSPSSHAPAGQFCEDHPTPLRRGTYREISLLAFWRLHPSDCQFDKPPEQRRINRPHTQRTAWQFPSAGSYNTTPPTVAAFVSSYFRTFDERRLVIETCSWTTCRASTSPVGLGGQELSFGGSLASHRSILEQFTRLPRSTYGLGTNRRLRTRIPEYPFRLEFVPQWAPGRPFPGCREPCLRRGRGRSARRALHSQDPPCARICNGAPRPRRKWFATEEVAQAWIDENDREGVGFEYEVIGAPA